MTAPLDPQTDVALDLVRCSLIVKLAVDLEDPALVRRAAGQAAGAARLLAGLDLPDDPDPDVHASVAEPGTTVAELLARLYPAARAPEEPEADDPDDLDDPQHYAEPGGWAPPARLPSRRRLYADAVREAAS